MEPSLKMAAGISLPDIMSLADFNSPGPEGMISEPIVGLISYKIPRRFL
jgi:hypothetical protein